MIEFIINKLNSVNNPNSIHGVYPYRGKISPIDASQILDQIPENSNLLDPFCGSGTIVYESLKKNINALGVDLNPIATFIAEGKINVPTTLESVIEEAKLFIKKSKTIKRDFSERKSSIYFHNDSHNQICTISSFFDKMSPYLRACFLGSIALTARGCNHYKWTSSTVGKNIEPKRYIDFYEKLLYKINKHYYPVNSKASSKIIKCDSRELSKKISGNSIDFVFTSPPYFDCLDYTAYYAKIIYSILKLDRVEIRAGLIQTFKTYEKDMQLVLNQLHKVCRKGARILFVVGDKKVKGKVINGADFFNKISPFKTVEIIEREYKGTSSQVFDKLNKTKRKEQVIIWTK